jgi:hypothetical protein
MTAGANANPSFAQNFSSRKRRWLTASHNQTVTNQGKAHHARLLTLEGTELG